MTAALASTSVTNEQYHVVDRSLPETSRSSRLSTRQASKREYYLVLAFAFTIFMVIALFARLLPRARRERLLGACVDGNVFAQAKAMAGMTIPFAFMG
jgi:hypothetical protein